MHCIRLEHSYSVRNSAVASCTVIAIVSKLSLGELSNQ
jgi:hypothetical protein